MKSKLVTLSGLCPCGKQQSLGSNRGNGVTVNFKIQNLAFIQGFPSEHQSRTSCSPTGGREQDDDTKSSRESGRGLGDSHNPVAKYRTRKPSPRGSHQHQPRVRLRRTAPPGVSVHTEEILVPNPAQPCQPRVRGLPARGGRL